MRCIMVGTKSTQSTRYCSISASARSASKRRIATTVPPMQELRPRGDEGPGVVERAGHER